ncbi:MAG TPA: hypothetical protein DCP67_07620 [Planctomycetaceae bacterium]|nr:hypothetical protein [Rhodopirellula sp.]MCH2361193.1 DUF4254 domain-containing protein [Pirellulales bacterium]HAL13668.1 hypothetical protein [Planctomycetaceae bacterium]
MINVKKLTDLHKHLVEKWHEDDISNPYVGLEALVCTQFSFNFQLWHEEDIARSRDVGDAKIAEVKRNIDGFNQNRNDWIEKIDDYITDQLDELGIKPEADARLNTETPGSVIDRLSILALRIYHMEEQAGREDATDEHREKAQQKLAVCFLQMDNLSQSLQELIDDIYTGKMAHRTYRQFKMYNDPTMNPYLYKAQQRLAG